MVDFKENINKKLVASAEICDDTIKIVVGYVADNYPMIVYKKTVQLKSEVNSLLFNYANDALKNIFDDFYKAINIEDKDFRLKIKIHKIIMILPSFNLEILEQSEKKSVSNLKKISFDDVENIVESIKNKMSNKKDSRIVDIIPLIFQYDNGSSTIFPVNFNSDFLEIKTSLQLLPKNIVDSYDNLLKKIGIDYEYITASQAKAFLLKKRNCLCIDVGGSITVLNLILEGKVVYSNYFMFGTKQLIESLIGEFKIDVVLARRICSFFGLEKRELCFDPVINFDDTKKTLTISGLNRVIKKYFDDYFFLLDINIKKIFENYEDKNYDFVLVESDFTIVGFLDFMKDKCRPRKVEKLKLEIIGGREEKYFNCIGAIISSVNEYNYNNIKRKYFLKPININQK